MLYVYISIAKEYKLGFTKICFKGKQNSEASMNASASRELTNDKVSYSVNSNGQFEYLYLKKNLFMFSDRIIEKLVEN